MPQERIQCDGRSRRARRILAATVLMVLGISGSAWCENDRARGAAASSSAPARVRVTGRFYSFNRTAEVPVGLFSVCDFPLTREIVQEWGVEGVRLVQSAPTATPIIAAGARKEVPDGLQVIVQCFFDQYDPALLLTERDWKERLARLGRKFGENARFTDRLHLIEFWDEPGRNWGGPLGLNSAPEFYDDAPSPGAPVTIRGWDEPLAHLRWQRGLSALDRLTRVPNGRAAAMVHPPAEVGGVFEHEGRTYELAETWRATDAEEVEPWSGRQNSEFYRWMFIPFARAVKQANPEVRVVGGWGLPFSEGHWRAWDLLYRPLLDEGANWLDALGEHHYGLDARESVGSSETVVAYAVTHHRKPITIFTTAAACTDESDRGAEAPTSPADQLNRAQQELRYMVRDVIHRVDVCPDKSTFRAARRPRPGGGDELAFRLLRELRGRLVETQSDDADLWCVASCRGRRYCVVLFNDGARERRVALEVESPFHMPLTGGRKTTVAATEAGLKLQTEDVPVKGTAWSGEITLAPDEPVKLVFDFLHEPDGPITLTRTQQYAPEQRCVLAPGETAAFQVQVPPNQIKRLKGCWLRIVQENREPGHTSLSVNSQPVKLDYRRPWTYQTRLPPELLRSANTLTFSNDSAGEPWALDMVSLITEQ